MCYIILCVLGGEEPDPVLKVALHLRKQDTQPKFVDEPKCVEHYFHIQIIGGLIIVYLGVLAMW